MVFVRFRQLKHIAPLQSHSCPIQIRSRLDTPSRWNTTAQITSNDDLTAIVQEFPHQLDYAFGYGSAVLHQRNSNPTSSMVDIIMSVPDPHQWHAENLKRHPSHYSMMSRFGGPSFVTALQSNFGAKLYFHPYVNLNIRGSSDVRQIKYGVVSTSDLIHDLKHWEYLYLAGRMQKPIVTIQTDEGDLTLATEVRESIDSAQSSNLLAAVSSSLLLIGGETSQTSIAMSELYTTIASLSYTGDFRMQTGAEDPNKVRKLVDTPGMLDLWETKYADTLKLLQEHGLLSLATSREHEKDPRIEFNPYDIEARKELMKYLPQRLYEHKDRILGLDGQSCIQQGSRVLRKELANIVAPAARSQGIKGIFTAGPVKSWKYAMAKFAKGRLK